MKEKNSKVINLQDSKMKECRKKRIRFKEENLYRLIEYIVSAVIAVILLVLLLLGNRFNYVYKSFCKVPNYIFVAGIVLMRGGYYLIHKKKILFAKKRKKGKFEPSTVVRLKLQLERRNLALLSIILFGVQLIVAWQIYFKTGWDCGTLIKTAQAVAYRYADIGSNAYFSMYPNNVLLVAIFAAILRFTRFLGFNADYFPLVMIGCLLVNMAGFFMADCIRKLTKKNWIALAAWGMYMVLAGLSPWISIPYSDTYSILFPVFCIWLYMYRTEKNKYFIWFGIGFVGFIGYYIKPTVLLVVFVLMALETWHFIINFDKNQKKKGLKSAVTIVGALLFAVLFATSANEAARQKMGFTPDETKKFTPLHYMMMGLNYDTCGTYDQQDVNYSASALSVKERNRNAVEEIGNRISDMGLHGLVSHGTRKLLTNFNDGTFAWGKEGEFYWNIQNKNNGLSHQLRSYYYEDGIYYPLFQVLSQGMWVLTLILIVCLALPQEGKADRTVAAVLLGLLLIICFVMLFEARARYLYLYSPVFILAAALGLERFLEWVKRCVDLVTSDKECAKESGK